VGHAVVQAAVTLAVGILVVSTILNIIFW